MSEDMGSLPTEMSQSSSLSPQKLTLDMEASRHYDFLSQFEKAIVHSRMSNGKSGGLKKHLWFSLLLFLLSSRYLKQAYVSYEF